MPQIVPVSDFRADISSVGKFIDEGEIVVLTRAGAGDCGGAEQDGGERDIR